MKPQKEIGVSNREIERCRRLNRLGYRPIR